MGMREFAKSGAFIATILVLLVVLLPFALDELGDTTGLFKFRAKKTIMGWFSPQAGTGVPRGRAAPVDWDRYRRDLEAFANWVNGQSPATISMPLSEVVINVKEEEVTARRSIWAVPVASCTAGDPRTQRKGYVFISGFKHPYEEGAVIAPSEKLCGYEIVFVGERSVWFKAIFDDEGDAPMGVVRFPEFTRVEGERLVSGSREYVAHDAFPLASGGWLMIDSFLPPSSVVFKILDEKRCVAASILCVVIGEKGGRLMARLRNGA